MKLRWKSIFPPRDLGWNHVRAKCAQPDCHNKLLTRLVPGAKAGIFVQEQWYCSPDCFSSASRGFLAWLSTAEIIEVPRHPRLSLGLALLTKRFLTTEQFQLATSRSEAEKIDFETTVTERGWVTEKQLAAARAIQWGYPVLGQDLSGHRVVVDLPPILFRACSATPLYYSSQAKRLVLGFVHRVDHSLLQSIEQITECRAEPCFITPGELDRQLEHLAGPRHYRQVLMEHPGAIPQMARTLGGYAQELAATEALFTRCHSYVWTRVAGSKGTVDVLFQLKNADLPLPSEDSPVIPEINENVAELTFGKRANRRG